MKDFSYLIDKAIMIILMFLVFHNQDTLREKVKNLETNIAVLQRITK